MKYLGYIIDVIGIVTLIIGLYFFIKAKKQVKIENKRCEFIRPTSFIISLI